MQTHNQVLAKTGGDKHEIRENPRKLVVCRPRLPENSVGQTPEKGREKIGQHFPLQNDGETHMSGAV